MSGEGFTRWSGFRMRRNRGPLVFLAVAFVAFGFDLFHFGHHLGHDPTLLDLAGVRPKLVWKGTLFLLAILLLIFSPRAFVSLTIFILALGWGGGHAFAGSAGCEQARELMTESGVARDAKENFLGGVKIKPPRSSFPPEMDKVTWWGTFKPFEFWQSPQLEAAWVNPRGEIVERQSFRGGACALAKTTLAVQKLPRARLESGMWRVIVSCQDVTIDNHPFAVVGSSAPTQDGRVSEDSGVMIWADGVNS